MKARSLPQLPSILLCIAVPVVLMGAYMLRSAQARQDGHLREIRSGVAFPGIVALSRDGRWLAVGGGEQTRGGKISLLDAKTFKVARSFSTRNNTVPRTLTFTADSRILSATDEGDFSAWDTRSGKRIHHLQGVINTPATGVHVATVSPEASTLLSGHDRKIEVWDIGQGRVRKVWNWAGVSACRYSPDGKSVLVFGAHDELRDARSGQLLHKLSDSAIYHWFSPDGKKIISIGDEKGLEIWSLSNKRVLTKVPSLARVFEHGYTLALSPNATTLAVGQYSQARTPAEAMNLSFHPEGRVQLWNMKTGALIKSIPGFDSGVELIEWTPNGSRLIVGNGLKLWAIDVR